MISICCHPHLPFSKWECSLQSSYSGYTIVYLVSQCVCVFVCVCLLGRGLRRNVEFISQFSGPRDDTVVLIKRIRYIA